MKARKDEWLLCALFCGFLALMCLLLFLLPKSDFSETEKRYLADSPKLTADSLSSGDFGNDVESWMADHIPGRDFFVGLNSYYERLTLRQVTKDIYLAEGDRLVEKPVTFDEERVSKNVAAMLSFAKNCEVPVDVMLVPSGGWAVRDSVMGISDPYKDEQIISEVYSCLDGVNTFDALSVIGGHQDPAALYYRTDHHWTSLGAYLTYSAYMESKGREYPVREDFEVTLAEDFKGTTHSRAAMWLIPGEPIEMWHGPSDLTVTNAETNTPHAGVFYEERLQELDKYTVFLDGNHSLVRIENPEKDGTLLVFRDSYSNCLGGFLAESYGTVILVDLRYYNGDVLELCRSENADEVLICYSLSNFMTDQYLVKLYVD